MSASSVKEPLPFVRAALAALLLAVCLTALSFVGIQQAWATEDPANRAAAPAEAQPCAAVYENADGSGCTLVFQASATPQASADLGPLMQTVSLGSTFTAQPTYAGLPLTAVFAEAGTICPQVTKLSFANCEHLASVDLTELSLPALTDANRLFADCHELSSLNFGSLDTARVTTMAEMFAKIGRAHV